VTRFDAGSAPMTRRFARLTRRMVASRHPVVWLRAMPGTGKSRLVLNLERHAAVATAGWRFLDEPETEVLAAALAAALGDGGRGTPVPRLVIASHPTGTVADCLLKITLYGQVDVMDEHELFVREVDCRGKANLELLSDTGGWPLLVDGYSSGRALEMAQMLPAFLDRDVLPELPAPVVTALFGALPAPLSAPAVEYLFGSTPILHPLLTVTNGGVTVAGRWVREALLKLRTRPKALQRPILDDLIRLHTRFAEPVGAIISLLAIGQFTQAVEVFEAAGGMFFGYLHGYQALERVLESFGEEGERRTESVFLARLKLLIKSGRSREALLRLDAQYVGLPLDLRRLRVSHRPYALLMRLDLSLDLDEAPPLDVISSWGKLDAFLNPDDEMARGILYNTMAIGFLQAGALVQAQEFAEEALAVYERAGSPYLAHFMLLHLCDLSLRRSRLRDAADQLRRAEQALTASKLTFNSEPAIIAAFKARIAYEEGRFTDCPEEIEPIVDALLRGDSWSDLMSELTSHVVFTAFWLHGLRVAQDRLEHCAVALNRRHGALQNRRIELLRIRLYQVARRHAEAAMRLEEYDLDVRETKIPAQGAEEALIRLRDAILQGRSTVAVSKLASALGGRPGLEARHKIALSLLLAFLHHRSDEPAIARRYLNRALRSAEAACLVAPLVEDGEFLERVLPLFLAKPGPDNQRLLAFAQRVARLLRSLASVPLYSKMLAGVTRQEHRVLSYVVDGYTNKQIARALQSGESVVKFHLRNLFKKMKVSSRTALRDAAEKRGIRT
jgi:DNA-binding CsgD family transcriptional regulator/tetratricopeptide (TPR) repeat protein